MNFTRAVFKLLSSLLVLVASTAGAQSTNTTAATTVAPARVESTSQKLDESAFRIVSERNIFNGNRSGGTVRLASSRRPTRVETFTLVGTMAYEKGVFAFFEGSSSEFTKVLKTDGVIAGHKIADILADAVKLEADGKEIELTIGSQMRREDEGAWHMAEASGGSVSSGGNTSFASNRNNSDSNNRNGRFNRGGNNGRRTESNNNRGNNTPAAEASTSTSATPSSSSADAAEVLKRLMEQRAKE
ncbi:MAG: hypothetical protein EPO07_17955 [Verrucomicrobia bacterium]|nr:MAG: hypothetical protein EPO07_17955 [Verrucomicrobiota bacterium]